MINIVTLFIWFAIYSFLGWVWETTFCSIRAGHFINRGFLNGPVIPVYGFGAVFVMLAMSFFRSSEILTHLPYIDIPLVFFGGLVICTLLEYVTAVILESAFHIRWWDYSKQKFNFQGRICLKSALFFGLMSVVIIYIVQPLVSRVTVSIPADIANPLALVFLVLFAVDLAVTLSFCISSRILQMFSTASNMRQRSSKTMRRISVRMFLRLFPGQNGRFSAWQRHSRTLSPGIMTKPGRKSRNTQESNVPIFFSCFFLILRET